VAGLYDALWEKGVVAVPREANSMPLNTPYWFPARQGKAEEAGPDMYRLTAPNLQEAHIRIEQAPSGRWLAALRLAKDGPDVATSETDFATVYDAWEGAFELYRKHVVV
jgi:hypothetical protein